jgi:hypothetical protein
LCSFAAGPGKKYVASVAVRGLQVSRVTWARH